MKSEALAHGLKHVAALKELLEALRNDSVELHEHRYNYLVFGNWLLEAGHRKKRYRFAWDGKDSYLTVTTATFADSHKHTDWTEVPEHSGPATSAEAFAKVRDVLKHAV